MFSPLSGRALEHSTHKMANKDIPPEVQQEVDREFDRVRATILEASEPGLAQPGPMFNSSPRRTTTSQEKYAPGGHNVPGPLNITKWNIDHPVVWMNAILVVTLVSGAVLFWGRIVLLQAAGLIALLALVDYRVSRYV